MPKEYVGIQTTGDLKRHIKEFQTYFGGAKNLYMKTFFNYNRLLPGWDVNIIVTLLISTHHKIVIGRLNKGNTCSSQETIKYTGC